MGAKLSPSGSGNRYRRQHMSDINVTPLVDVMLVLLIIFMVAAPMMVAGVQVDLPETTAAPVQGQDEPIAISVNNRGEIYLQHSLTPLKDLVPKLKAIAGEKADTRIFVRGDKSVDYGTVMQVIGQINAGGFNRVALITEAAPEK